MPVTRSTSGRKPLPDSPESPDAVEAQTEDGALTENSARAATTSSEVATETTTAMEDSRRPASVPQPCAIAPAARTHRTTPSSRGSRRSSVKTKLLAQAKEKLARLRCEHLEAQIAAIEAMDSSDEGEEEEDEDEETVVMEKNATKVQEWMNESQRHTLAIAEEPFVAPREASMPQAALAAHARVPVVPKEPPQINRATQPGVDTPEALKPNENNVVATRQDLHLAKLADAITLAVRAGQNSHRHVVELPVYEGSHQEWLAFRAAYYESASTCSTTENLGRLRRALKGKAREAVQSLLINFTDPLEVMKTLESRFGRPDSIAIAELARLRAIPKPSDAPRDTCIFASRVNNAVATLRALDRGHYLFNPELTRITADKLGTSMKHRWYKYYTRQPKHEPDLVKLAKFLELEAEYCSLFAEPEPISAPDNKQRRTQRAYSTSTGNEKKCITCKTEAHALPDCKWFKKAEINDRWDVAKKNGLCFKCLAKRTRNHRCKGKACGVDGCDRTHHSLLHYTPRKKEETHDEEETNETVASTWLPRQLQSYLKIVKIRVSGPAGAVDTHALLDDGSTVTLIDAKLAEEVGAGGPIEPLTIEAIADTKIAASQSRRVKIDVVGTGPKHSIRARTIRHLQLAPQTVSEEDVANCKHLYGIKKELKYEKASPRILIGQDNWQLLIASEVRQGKPGQPVASLTSLGWVLHGAHTRALGRRVNYVNFLKTPEEDMNEQLRHYFSIESLLVKPGTPKSDPEQRALATLKKETIRLDGGRYSTGLLWKSETVKLPDNYQNSLSRLENIEKKLDKNPALKVKYNGLMEDLVKKGYAELAPPTKNERTWYLPHFAVINPMKPGKIRIVHDAAAKTKGTSLNDQLLTGPDLLQSLPGVLMRFRQHPVAVSADIKEMFMQVKIRTEDRDALRYLWRGDRRDGEPPDEYRMTSLIFGATCSPSTAIYVKNENASEYKKSHPRAAEAIVRNHYVDDYLDSFETEEEATQTARDVYNIHSAACFELRQWKSNSQRVLCELDVEAKQTPVSLDDRPENMERVLGLIWKPASDELAFNLDLARVPPAVLQSAAPTKREALRIVMSLYDPLGLASPVTIRAKQILQEVWRHGTGWDDRLDEKTATQWNEWMRHLERLRNISIPRRYIGYSKADSLQLHVYVDASEAAYAAALYWRAVTPSGDVIVSLIAAKARVAPLKLTSIPRLELQAAVMGSRMAAAVIEEHTRKPESKTFWTDSRTVLTWLRTGSRSYRPFVAHRLADIEENTSINEWRWVPTKLNVADDATRDVPDDFGTTHRWYTGPEYLRLEEEHWPQEDKKTSSLPTGEERVNAHTVSLTHRLSEALPDARRFSSWLRLVRSTGRVLQFIDLCRPHKGTARRPQASPSPLDRRRWEPLFPQYVREAELLWLRAMQQDCFGREIEDVTGGREASKDSRLRQLALKVDDRGVLRLRSRIEATLDINDEQKEPAIMDGDHPYSRLYIYWIHKRAHHSGVEFVTNEVRQRFHVLRLRPTVRTVLKRCQPCRLRRASAPNPPTGNLPGARVAHHRRPFTYTGVDYFGPVSVTVGRQHHKKYVALFTCLTTRAVHLEVAASLSTDSAILALRRMMARRGCPEEIWSDNGTNLRGADAELRRASLEAMEREANVRNIHWRFIPPSAPFMGGAWERLVRSVKTALRTTLEERHPTEEVLTTLLAEVEHTVNSRPLTHVATAPDDDTALTPNHFLLGGPSRVPTPGTFTEKDTVGRNTWRTSQRLADAFWARWVREVLPLLQHRREVRGHGEAVKIGDVVIIADGNLPRNVWPRGIVTHIYPGPDGVVRTADVQTQTGVLRRPVKKLVVLPVDPRPLTED